MARESAWLTHGIADLRTRLRGQLLELADAGYDEARRIWNAMIDKRPRYIVRCADVTDVQWAVRFAREYGLPMSIRGGGHNIAGQRYDHRLRNSSNAPGSFRVATDRGVPRSTARGRLGAAPSGAVRQYIRHAAARVVAKPPERRVSLGH